MKRTCHFALAAAFALGLASPAMAGGRVELRAGALNDKGVGGTQAGVAVGYDFDLGGPLFVGAEASLDIDLADASNGSVDALIGLTGRVGTKVGPGGKLFLAGGQTIRSIDTAPYHLGGGFEQAIGPAVYVKAEYRHYFSDNLYTGGDSYLVGVGLKF